MSLRDPRRAPIADVGERVALGIPELDYYLWGGIPRGSVALVIGPQYAGKETMAELFLGTGVANGEPTMAIFTDSAISEWQEAIRHHAPEADLDDPDTAVFMDLFPVSDDERPKNIIEVPRPLTAEKTAAACNRALDKVDGEYAGRFVFESLSTLIHERGLNDLYDYLPPLMARVRRSKATGLVLLEDGVLTETEVRVVQRWFNGVIEMKRFEDHDAVRVTGLGLSRPSPWIQYIGEARSIRVTHRWSQDRIH